MQKLIRSYDVTHGSGTDNVPSWSFSLKDGVKTDSLLIPYHAIDHMRVENELKSFNRPDPLCGGLACTNVVGQAIVGCSEV